MLQKLNERLKGIIAWVIIIMIAITFALVGIDYYMQSAQNSNVQVEVNGEPIFKQDLMVNFNRARQQQDKEFLDFANEKTLKNKVLQEMIINRVSLQAALASGFVVRPEQVERVIHNIPQFQHDGQFSVKHYMQALHGAMFTPETFHKEIQQGMLLNQQKFAFMGSAFVLPNEINKFASLYLQTRDYNYLQIPIEKFIDPKLISESAISEYYNKNRKEFITPLKISLDYIQLSLQDIKNQIKISPEDLHKYYEENKGNFALPAQWKVAHILFALSKDADTEQREEVFYKANKVYQELLKNPDLFNEYVKTSSDDQLAKNTEGILPWINAGQTEFDKALVTLHQEGQISPPFKSTHGYEIFKLIKFKPGVEPAFPKISSKLSEQLINERAQKMYSDMQEQLSDLSYQTPDTLEPAAQALQLPIQQTNFFTKAGGNTALTQNKQLLNLAFNNDILELGNNSEALQLDDNSIVVFRVRKQKLPAIKLLTEVQQEIRTKLALEKAKKDVVNFAQNLNDNQQLLAKYNLKWQTVNNAKRDAEQDENLINNSAFRLIMQHPRTGFSLPSGDYVILVLKKIVPGDLNTLSKDQQESLNQQLEAGNGIIAYDIYISNLMKLAKIKL